MSYYVYIHTCPNGKRYVGITTKNPKYRWSKGNGYKPNKHCLGPCLKNNKSGFYKGYKIAYVI